MQRPSHLDFSRLPGSSRLFLDFLSGDASTFFHRPFGQEHSYGELQQQLHTRHFNRPTLIDVLRRQNISYGAGEKVLQNIEKLGQANTLAVLTGQQVTLLGGSILTFYKAAIATRLAETNCRKLNADVVPIFWMAADDADLAEVAEVYLPSRDDQLHKLVYQAESDVIGRPMSAIHLNDKINELLDQYRDLLPETEFRDDLIDQLRRFYQPGESVVTAFGKYLSWLFRDHGLILVDPSDPELRKLAAPLLRKEIELARQSSAAVAEQNRRLESAGYHQQVVRPGDYSNLFYDDDKRLRVDITEAGFRIGDREYTEGNLLALIDEHPERFSPNVLLRPIVQSHLFPTLVHFVGPAEAAYIAQIKGLFEMFDQPAPIIYPRFSATILEPKVVRLLEKYDLEVTDIAEGVDDVITRVMKRSFSDDLESSFGRARAEVKERLEELLGLLDPEDEGLLTTARKSIGKVDYEIDSLEGKVFQAHKKRNKIVRNQIERAAFYLFPDGKLQEKVFPLNYYIALYGPEMVGRLYDVMDCNTAVHHLIDLKDA